MTTITDAEPPALCAATADAGRERSRRQLAVTGAVATFAVVLAAAWWTMAVPQVHLAEDFAAVTGPVNDAAVTFKTTVRNDGRFATELRPGAVPPTISMAFQSTPDDPTTPSVKLAPGQEAVVLVTIAHKPCAASPPGATYSPHFAVQAATWGRSTQTAAVAPVQFPLCEAPPGT